MTNANRLKKELPLLVMLIAPFVLLPFIWDQLPDVVTIHWNTRGEPDRFAGKTLGLLLLPSINVALYVFFWLIPRVDPKEEVGFRKKPLPSLRLFTMLIVLLLFLVNISMMLDMGGLAGSGRPVPIVIIVMFFGLGNYMSSVQPNYFIGIKTPWTLQDPEIWKKTHRLGGRLWVACSVVLLVLWAILPVATFHRVMAAVVLIVMVAVPVLYSYLLYARQKGTDESVESDTD